MAEVKLNTKICLKTKTWAEWQETGNASYKPKFGEVCICSLPDTQNGNIKQSTPPTVLFKVGTDKNENTTFADLPWATALAADVYSWAKQDANAFMEWLGGNITINGTSNYPITSIGVDASSHKIVAKTGTIPYSAIIGAPTEVGVMSIQAGNGISVDTTTASKPKISINTGVTDSTHNVTLTATASGLQANVDLSAYQKIADDKDTKYGLAYEDGNIKLVEGGQSLSISASDFIKDGMIESGEITKNDSGVKVLRLTFNTDASNKTVDIPVNELVDVYTASNAAGAPVTISVSNTNQISAALTNGGVTADKLAANAVVEAKIANGAITTNKIAANAVTQEKLGTDVTGLITKAQTAADNAQTAADNAQSTADEAKSAAAAAITTAGTGLKKSGQTISFDDTNTVFILDCN